MKSAHESGKKIVEYSQEDPERGRPLGQTFADSPHVFKRRCADVHEGLESEMEGEVVGHHVLHKIGMAFVVHGVYKCA